jgi:hypothetical protein
MSTIVVHKEKREKIATGWDELITYSESAIEAYTLKIKELRKSLIFFKKQSDLGMPYPLKKEHRHSELS